MSTLQEFDDTLVLYVYKPPEANEEGDPVVEVKGCLDYMYKSCGKSAQRQKSRGGP